MSPENVSNHGRVFVEDADSHEVVFECMTKAEAFGYLRSVDTTPGTYNVLSRIEMGLLVEPPRMVRGNRLNRGIAYRKARTKKAAVPANDIDPNEDVAPLV